jgi:predicted N-acetyltransferase YhbS
MASNISYANNISADDYNALRELVGWSKMPSEQAQLTIDGSAFLVAAYDGERVVGAARIVGDGASAALIKDVMVAPDYQMRGIGRELMNLVMTFLQEQLKPGWRMLLDLSATNGKEPFYSKFGFEVRPNEHFGNGMAMWLTSE